MMIPLGAVKSPDFGSYSTSPSGFWARISQPISGSAAGAEGRSTTNRSGSSGRSDLKCFIRRGQLSKRAWHCQGGNCERVPGRVAGGGLAPLWILTNASGRKYAKLNPKHDKHRV